MSVGGAGSSPTRQPHKRLRHLESPSGRHFPSVAPHGALGQEAKLRAQIEHQPPCLDLEAQFLAISELVGLRPPLEV